jgi:hypothetical protein
MYVYVDRDVSQQDGTMADNPEEAMKEKETQGRCLMCQVMLMLA